ncbi:GTPase domain-containing protein [Dietzia cinnamea]|uniref:GTPase domain-containing protein n=2 Tax=Dietzia cinnamea TaxID=321318 RepID=A0ABV3YJV4_9ACTN|nr:MULTISPECIES: GTPase domain-containing protein [Dietzia]KZO59974.1 ATP/GTP-binding protein [Dietzia maris]MBM7229570.1 GTPase domain-containing protein [Dietzia cinnamea]MCT1641057.1 GTPase domain-containing protein [Dietzia cinnamea]MCT2059658.1 GTPase domain-containing protein [Dietzia cinnamea]MCT2097818.1 GTPase domain-containing protein [Dietzia cinnamea]
MKIGKNLQQQIAVFGESGSGKTVLLSSFYGATQEPRFIEKNHFSVIADDQGKGLTLHRLYLAMRDSTKVPSLNRFKGDSHDFTVHLKTLAGRRKDRSGKIEGLHLVWHDYPGEWFESSPHGDEETRRRLAMFRSLLGSDVALLLVDAQRLIDNEGEEERYLKLLFTNFKNSIVGLKSGLLDDGKPRKEFPRIWIIALSKADLLPDADVYRFRDLVIEKAGGEIAQLRDELRSMVVAADALDIGQDFLLLSSAKFEPGKIVMSQRKGVDLILPIASVMPLERYARWAGNFKAPGKVLEVMLRGAGPLLTGLLLKQDGKFKPAKIMAKFVGTEVILEIASLAADKVKEFNENSRTKGDAVGVTLSQFKLDLDAAENDHVLIRSKA